ncbi:RagB/SusD family nutrient uptake outer membrane protein [Pedobacter gandavensis]|uniref:RagB/SusD family nutrient uptake outer membrane protein n=1 Tax=Pedobacter gandavensis TaxID=2679963 RepID=A0ABR6ES94_9SPHI|nr:RagB/SusD family nutrient uptake outer membrane protein [Pedobacter gandavensis]MBB2148127.1 RagB/SusD family nutrient uptake outer membrane protein [Pedobacter gandavensis]
MKLSNRYLIYTLLATVFLSTGCKKLVDIDEPINTVTSVRIFASDAQADQTLAGMYSQMVGNDNTTTLIQGGATIYGGLAADEFNVTNSVNYPEDYDVFRNNIMTKNSISETVLWLPAYKVINTANAILDGEAASVSSNLTKGKRIEMKASAKFIRAYCYFYLSNFFGEIPLVLTSDFTKNLRLKRVAQEEVYQQMITDLKEALALLSDPDAVALKAKSRVTKAAVQALLARTYLYLKDWENAEKYATEVIGSNAFQLETLAKTFDATSKETIFQLYVNPGVVFGLGETINLSPAAPLSLFPPADQAMFLDPDNYDGFAEVLQPRIGLNEGLVNAFEDGDKRKTTWVNYNGTPNVSPYFAKRFYFADKYPMSDTERTNYVLMRLAEVYLIRAEARAMQNKISLVAGDLNLIRNRAGLGNTTATNQTALLEAIAQERRTELFAEWGHRFFDLKRTGKALSVLATIPEKQGVTANRLLFPIPSKEILANSNLTQNPGY